MKRILIMVVSVLLIVSLTACGFTPKVKETHIDLTGGSKSAEAEESMQTEKKTQEAEATEEVPVIQEVAIGDVITTENKEITLNNVEFSYDVLPDDTSGFYTHYAADEGKVYIHVDTDVKNLAKQNLRCDKILSIMADYNDGYQYSGQAIVDDSQVGFNYSNITSITPLETLGVHFLISCPQEVEESTESLDIIFNVDGTDYVYHMR